MEWKEIRNEREGRGEEERGRRELRGEEVGSVVESTTILKIDPASLATSHGSLERATPVPLASKYICVISTVVQAYSRNWVLVH